MPTVSRWLGDRPQYFDSNGDPGASYRLFFYVAGTATKAETYTTSAGSVANSNPMTLDAAGRPEQMIFLDVSVTYDIKLCAAGSDDPPAAAVWTEEDIVPIDPGGTSVFADDEFQVTGSGDATKILKFQVDGLTTETTRTLTVQDKPGSIALTSEFAYSNVAGSPGRMLLPPMWISGLIISNNAGDATNDVDISAGMCRDATDAHNLVLTSTLTKKIDAAWTVGTDQGGLDGSESVTGTPDNSTWYFVWLIKRSDTGVVDALFSESSAAPSMPTNYDYKRLIGAVYNSGDAIEQFFAYETSGGGMRVTYKVGPRVIIDTTNVNYNTGQLLTLLVPSGVNVEAIISDAHLDSGASHWTTWQDPSETQAVPTFGAMSGSGAATAVLAVGQGIRVMTDTASQVRVSTGQSDGSAVVIDTFKAALIGYEWSRR